MSGTEKTIDQFAGWEETSQQHDFFGEVNLKEDVISTVEKDDLEDPVEKEKAKEKVLQEKEEEELIDKQFESFSNPTPVSTEDEEEDTSSKTGDEKGKKAPTTKVGNKTTLEFLKEKGLVEYEEDPENPLTEEDAENIIEDSWETALEKGIEETIKELPEDLKELVRFANKGGDFKDLLSKMATQTVSGISKNSDIEKEEVQIMAISLDLKSQGYDQEYINEQIEFLKEKEKLETIGKKSFDKIISQQSKEIEQEVVNQKQAAENRKAAARTYKSNITTHINSLEEVKGLPLSKQDKGTLPTYISEPTVELQDGRIVSEMQADLFNVMADKDKIVLLAKLLKSDFDFGAIERKKQTQAARGIKDAVQRADKTQSVSNSSSGGHKPNKKALWDMLED